MCSQAAEKRRNVEHLSSFQKLAWASHPVLLGLLSICSISEFFLPFIDSDGSKFPWLRSSHISYKRPFSFWIGSVLQLSVLSPSVYSQTCKRHFWDPYQTASFPDGGLPKSSIKLYFLADPLPLSLMKKKKTLKKSAIAYQADQERKCFLLLSCLFAWGCFLLPYILHTSSERQRLSF